MIERGTVGLKEQQWFPKTGFEFSRHRVTHRVNQQQSNSDVEDEDNCVVSWKRKSVVQQPHTLWLLNEKVEKDLNRWERTNNRIRVSRLTTISKKRRMDQRETKRIHTRDKPVLLFLFRPKMYYDSVKNESGWRRREMMTWCWTRRRESVFLLFLTQEMMIIWSWERLLTLGRIVSQFQLELFLSRRVGTRKVFLAEVVVDHIRILCLWRRDYGTWLSSRISSSSVMMIVGVSCLAMSGRKGHDFTVSLFLGWFSIRKSERRNIRSSVTQSVHNDGWTFLSVLSPVLCEVSLTFSMSWKRKRKKKETSLPFSAQCNVIEVYVYIRVSYAVLSKERFIVCVTEQHRVRKWGKSKRERKGEERQTTFDGKHS